MEFKWLRRLLFTVTGPRDVDEAVIVDIVLVNRKLFMRYSAKRSIQAWESQMKVSIKEFEITMEIKNKGIELDVYDNDDKHLGDLVVTKTGLTWCKGRTKVENGVKIKWQNFIDYMEQPK